MSKHSQSELSPLMKDRHSRIWLIVCVGSMSILAAETAIYFALYKNGWPILHLLAGTTLCVGVTYIFVAQLFTKREEVFRSLKQHPTAYPLFGFVIALLQVPIGTALFGAAGLFATLLLSDLTDWWPIPQIPWDLYPTVLYTIGFPFGFYAAWTINRIVATQMEGMASIAEEMSADAR